MPEPRAGLLGSLRLPDFRRLWLAIAEAGSGQWALQLGLGWLIQTVTHSSFWVGASLFAMQIPNVVAAPWTGVLADRFDRARLLAAALAVSAAGAAGLALVGGLGHASILAILGLTLVLGVANTLLSTASTALLPNVVPDTDLLNASALQAIAQRGSEFVGPAIGAVLLAATGSWSVFALCAAFYAVGAVQSLGIHPRVRAAKEAGAKGAPSGPDDASEVPAGPEAGAAPRGRGRFMEGVRYVRANQPLGLLQVVVLQHCALTMAYMGVLPAFVQQTLRGGPGLFGSVMTVVGLGSIVGALPLMAVKNPRVRGRMYLWSALASGVATAVLGLSRSPAAALVAAVAVGASQSMFMTISFAEVQERSSDEYRGRVSAIYLLLAGGAMAVANWGYGFLGGVLAPARILSGMGTAFVIIFLIYMIGSDALRGVCQLPPRRRAPVAVPLAEGE